MNKIPVPPKKIPVPQQQPVTPIKNVAPPKIVTTTNQPETTTKHKLTTVNKPRTVAKPQLSVPKTETVVENPAIVVSEQPKQEAEPIVVQKPPVVVQKPKAIKKQSVSMPQPKPEVKNEQPPVKEKKVEKKEAPKVEEVKEDKSPIISIPKRERSVEDVVSEFTPRKKKNSSTPKAPIVDASQVEVGKEIPVETIEIHKPIIPPNQKTIEVTFKPIFRDEENKNKPVPKDPNADEVISGLVDVLADKFVTKAELPKLVEAAIQQIIIKNNKH